MIRVLLSHHAGSVELPQGETIVGRGLSCSIRFNDPGISREHLRLQVNGSKITIEELGSTNGTRVNGERLVGLTEISDGDELQIGFRWLHLRVVAGNNEAQDEDTQSGLSARDDEGITTNAGLMDIITAPPFGPSHPLPILDKVTCSSCRELLDAGLQKCPKCGQHIAHSRYRSVTKRMQLPGYERRAATRYPVDIPLLYSSDTLTFDAVARDLSVSGIFIASELLDPIGTRCSITILPDGSPPVSLVGVVCRVIEAEGGSGGRPPGLGIKFDNLTEESEHWLEIYIDQHASN